MAKVVAVSNIIYKKRRSKLDIMKQKVSIICWVLAIFLILGAGKLLSYEKEIKAISATTAESIASLGKKTVAVVDFTDLQGNVTELGRFLAEELSVALASSARGFEVVDRTHLKTLLQEHKLSATGLIDPQTARKLGQIAGVEALVTGSITPFGDSIRLAVKVLDTNTAKMIGATAADIPKTKAVEELLSKGIDNVPSSSSGTSQTSASPSRPQMPKPIMRVDTNNFTFQLQQVKLSGTSLTFYFIVTNNDPDRFFRIYGSRIIDGSGAEYKANRYQLGNYWTTYVTENTLVSGVPMKASISFDGIAPDATLIALFELECFEDGQRKNFKVQFRNIPLTR